MKKMIVESESPIAKSKVGAEAVISGSADMYGACSIETFSSASPLGLTHEDAQGWIDYVTKFTPGNFWYKDSGVQVWLYEEQYDNWQDTYGADAVVAFYHSGHGAMDNNGVFQIPLGSKWSNRDWAFSSDMRLGNETVRYIFWSTCYSCRISGTHNPIRTWHPANLGFRMLFGFETVSVDDANYGKFFWEEWNKNKSFSTAWLDASWRISHNQTPTVVATGATAAEAQNRVFNERIFDGAATSRNFYHWRWYSAAATTSEMLLASTAAIPAEPKIAILESATTQDRELVKAATVLGFSNKATETMLYDRDGNAYLKDGDKRASVAKDGTISIVTGKYNYENTRQISQDKAITIAKSVLAETGFDKKADLRIEKVIHGFSCGGSSKGGGEIGEPVVTETIVQFRQLIDGLPTINDGNGLVRVSIDNDGNVIAITNSAKKVVDLSTKAKSTLAPDSNRKGAADSKYASFDEKTLDKLFQQKLAAILARNSATETNGTGALRSASAKDAEIIEEKIGYNVNGGYGSIEAQREYEVDFGDNLKKRYKVRVPIYS
ncbi:DUF6345 domain-containing protein [Hymenobacter tibetensis]|uniref:DUF6345 domain-containing protein n=1 Tax=Hymenobacter tibetensis TaxID=497967 RepID=A0ABY4D178_9BACT|nr:DUF6345 domain-containing protein [Hymenobacter tibetensis]UOG73718.1 DUF6345 domain-containing protein [Hymenobacter tibetensis]